MYSLTHLSDQTLLRDLVALVARDRITTAALLAHLAEVDARKLYLPAAHQSMYGYCVHELGLSEDAAFKRIQAARVARRFPAVFEAVADGRLHLSGVCLLAPHLSEETAPELLSSAAGKSKAEIERLLAERFPRPELPVRVQLIAPPTDQLAPGQVEPGCEQPAPEPAEPPAQRPKVAPLAPQRYSLQLTMSQDTHDKLRYAQELLSHQVALGDVEGVLDRALDALILKLEKAKFAATSRPRRPGSTSGGRHVPAYVKRAVWERDGGQCTFVSESGRRCTSRTFLEFDHVDEVARGGRESVSGIRLRCRAHNQYEAERTFGVGFMHDKREGARERQEARRSPEGQQRLEAQRAAAERAQTHAWKEAEEAKAQAAAKEKAAEVIPWLRALGIRADQARQAAALCESIPEATLEQRVRRALAYFGPRASSVGRVAAGGP